MLLQETRRRARVVPGSGDDRFGSERSVPGRLEKLRMRLRRIARSPSGECSDSRSIIRLRGMSRPEASAGVDGAPTEPCLSGAGGPPPTTRPGGRGDQARNWPVGSRRLASCLQSNDWTHMPWAARWRAAPAFPDKVGVVALPAKVQSQNATSLIEARSKDCSACFRVLTRSSRSRSGYRFQCLHPRPSTPGSDCSVGVFTGVSPA